MNKKILNLINNNKWDTAISSLKNMFDPIYDEKTLFHYACLRGNKKIITKYLETNSDKIYISDNDGNTGLHLLAFGGWDDILIDISKTNPTFLKLKNTNDDFIYDFVLDRYETLKNIVKIMIDNNFTTYLNFIKITDRTFILDLIDMSAESDEKYLTILKMIFDTNPDLTIPKLSPPLIYSIVKKYDNVTYFMLEKLKTNVNVKSDRQITPFTLAILQKNTKLANEILKLNPDVNYAGLENKNVPLSMCWKYGLINIAEKLLKCDTIDFNKKDAMLNTPIYYLIYLIAKSRSNSNSNSNGDLSKEQAKKIHKQLHKQLKILIINSDLENLNINNETPLHLLVKYKLWQYYQDDISKKPLNLNVVSKNNESPGSLLSDEELSDFLSLQNSSSVYLLSRQLVTLPKIASIESDGEYGLFNADGIHNIIYIFVMLSKYKKLIIPYQSNNPEKQKWDMYKTISHSSESDDTVSMVKSLMSFYYTAFYRVVPAIIIWKNKNLYFSENDKIYLQRCLQDDLTDSGNSADLTDSANSADSADLADSADSADLTKRFIMLRITLVLDDSALHANIVIYDKKLNKLIRFEPYGDWEFNDSYNLDEMLIKLFQDSLDLIDPDKKKSLKYIRPRDFLDKTKFQTTSMGDNYIEKNLGDPIGYCLAWCFWFLELKLNNPDQDENQLVNLALSQIIKNDNTNNNPLLTHIRLYAKQLDKDKNKLLQKMGIPKAEIYKMAYDGQKIDLIKKYVEKYVFT